jgi:hypothetical protein
VLHGIVSGWEHLCGIAVTLMLCQDMGFVSAHTSGSALHLIIE